MLTPQFLLPIASELAVDLFAGGGGASTGIEQAIGRPVDIAINHDPQAVSVHTVNHPQTRHYISDVFEVDPVEVTEGRPVGMLWASPDCKHFSKAKGGKPVSKKIRGLATIVVEWVRKLGPRKKPRVIFLENVEEFVTWGPLDENDMPDRARKGEHFQEWKAALEAEGYVVEHRELRASEHGTPTIRKRLFVIARCDGEPIVWPEATTGKPDSLPVRAKKRKPWRTAAECIDWSIPCPSIFERKKPLAEATMRRVAKGVMRYVVDCADPFIVPIANWSSERVNSIAEPLTTVTANPKGGSHALVVPTLVQTGYGERPGQAPRVPGLDKPLGTAVDGQKHALVTAFLAQHNTGNDGHDARKPMSTIVGKGCTQGVVTAHITKFRTGSTGHAANEPLHTVTASSFVKRPGGSAPLGLVTTHLMVNNTGHRGASANEPMPTITTGGHFAEVRAFLIKYYGSDQNPQLNEPLHTVTTKDRFGLVTVRGEEYAIVDIGLRMLTPRELYRAQGFPDTYIIDRGAKGEPMTKTAQVRMCGNSVCPPLARAIVAANYVERGQERAVA